MNRLKIAAIAFGILMSSQALCAQETATSEQWDATRQAKAENVRVETSSVLDSFLRGIKEGSKRLEEGFAGFYPKLGGVADHSGFGLGAEYRRSGIAGSRIEFRLGAQATRLNYKRYEAGLRLPQFAGRWLSLELNGVHRDYPRESFYGLGMDSDSAAHTGYHLIDTGALAVFKVHVRPWLSAGIRGGLLDVGISRGADSQLSSTEDVFSGPEAPGVQTRTRYKVLSTFAEADTRDEKGNPRSGSLYTASITSYYDRRPSQFSFTKFDAEAQHYIPFFNKRRVVALRALISTTDTAADQEVPFFMQPRIGGSHDLRGFADSRFHGRNSAVFNAEYRWEVFSGLDMAVFGDTGQVARSRSDFRLDKFRTSYGVGLRVNTTRSVFLRADLGFSRQEGRQLSLNFGHVF